MGFKESFKPNVLAAPVGKSREITLTFTGITEMSEKELKALPDKGFDIVTFNFKFNGTIDAPIELRHRRKHIDKSQGKAETKWEEYSFANNFANDMFQVADVDITTATIDDLIGKQFTIIITKTDKGIPNYNIKSNETEETSSEESPF